MDDGLRSGEKEATTIVRGASVFGIGQVVSQGFGFLANLLLTNALGASVYGVYIFGIRIVSLSSMFAGLGSKNALLRYIPKYSNDPSRQNQTVSLVVLSSATGSVLLSIGIYISAPIINSLTLENPLFVQVLRILAIILPFRTLSSIVMNVFRGLELLEYRELLASIIQPSLRIGAIGIAILIGASAIGIIAALVVTAGLLVVISFSLLISRTSIRPALGFDIEEATEYFSYSLPLTAAQAGSLIYNQIDIFMVGFFLSSTAVGIYGIAVVIAGILVLPLTAVNQLFPPVASDLYEQNKYDELRGIYQTSARWTFTVSLFLTVAVIIYRRELLRLFGEEFIAGTTVISLFAIGKLTNASVGPSGFVLMMTDHQYVNLTNQWVAGGLNVILNYIFILQFGIVGAALGTATTETLLNLTRIIEVWWFEGIHPYSWRFLKPTIAGLAAGAVMYGTGYVLNGFVLMILGGGIGGAVFLSLLVALGLEQTDHQLLRQTKEKLSDSVSSLQRHTGK